MGLSTSSTIYKKIQMTNTEKNNFFALIDLYILREQVIPCYKNLVSYDPVFRTFMKDLWITTKNFWSLAQEYYIKRMKQFYEETWKFPHIHTMKKHNDTYKALFSIFDTKALEKSYKALMKEYFNSVLLSWTKTKMKTTLQDKYKSHKDLFEDFYLMNVYNIDTQSPEFQKIWEEIKNIVIDCENILVGRMEGWKFGKFSASTRDKFLKLVNEIFPYYYQIWVKVRKA